LKKLARPGPVHNPERANPAPNIMHPRTKIVSMGANASGMSNDA